MNKFQYDFTYTKNLVYIKSLISASLAVAH